MKAHGRTWSRVAVRWVIGTRSPVRAASETGLRKALWSLLTQYLGGDVAQEIADDPSLKGWTALVFTLEFFGDDPPARSAVEGAVAEFANLYHHTRKLPGRLPLAAHHPACLTIAPDRDRRDDGLMGWGAEPRKQDPVQAVSSLADSTLPKPVPAEIQTLETIVNDARANGPADRKKFVDLVNQLLRANNHCFEIQKDGGVTISTHLILKNGAIQYALARGSAGFSKYPARLIPYRRPYVRRQDAE